MLLKDYLKINGLKMCYVADKIGVSRVTICALKQGKAVSEEVAQKLIDFTKGEVDVAVLKGNKSHVRNRRKTQVPQSA